MLRTITGFALRRPVLVIVLWSAVLVGGFGVGIGVFERLDPTVGTVPGSESAVAAERLAAASPEPPQITAVIDGAEPGALAAAVADLRATPGVTNVSEPMPAPRTADVVVLRVTLAGTAQNGPAGTAQNSPAGTAQNGPAGTAQSAPSGAEGSPVVAETAAERLRQIAGATVTVAGGPLTEAEYGEQAQSDVRRAELFSMPVVLVLLLLIFGGLLAAGLPLLIAVVGIGGTLGVLFGFSLVTDVSVYAVQVTTMVSVGLAVDYALLLVSRFREERATGRVDAISHTMLSAGRTVLFTGLTVAVALAGLLVFPDPFLRSLGLAAVAVVVVNMLAALTLLPALLALVGHRISPARPRPPGGGIFARVATAVQRRPLVTLVATAGALVVLALPALDLRISTGDSRSLPPGSATRQLDEALARDFPTLTGPEPLLVLASAPSSSPDVAALRDRIGAVPGITRVELASVADTSSVLRAYPSARPAADATQKAVAAIRALPAPFQVRVTGPAARLADYQAMLGARAPWAIALVALGTLVLLFAFTGSVVLPIKAVLTNMLSIGAALGVVVWVFQEGNLVALFGSVRLDETNLTVPVLVAAIAFGLSVDYEMFLLSRIRERWLAGAAPDRAVAEGLQQTGRLVTSAALLLVVVFAGFLVGGFAPIKQIGLGLVLAIAVDATVVRMLLVPATMTLLGRLNWWAPGSLRRLHTRFGASELDSAPAIPPRILADSTVS